MIKNTPKIILTISILALILSLVAEYIFNFQPCAWCSLQRLIVLIIAFLALISIKAVNKAFWQRLCAILLLTFSSAGALSAWYQYAVSSHDISCSRTIADLIMSKYTGLDAAVPWLFGIKASCIDAVVVILGLEFSLWSLILFIMLAILSLFLLFAPIKKKFNLY